MSTYTSFLTVPSDLTGELANYLLVGHKESGEDHAVLYTLVASCEKNGVNPVEYLTDVLTRVQTHPKSRVDGLLPHRWKPPDSAVAATIV